MRTTGDKEDGQPMQLVAPSLTEVAVRPPPLNPNCQQIATKERKSTLLLTNCIVLVFPNLRKLWQFKNYLEIKKMMESQGRKIWMDKGN